MMRLRYTLLLISSVLIGLLTWSLYNYFFDGTTPVVVVRGIEYDSYCAGDVQCILESNKKGEVALWLDGTLLTDKYTISARDAHPFAIPTKTISNGKHMLKVEVTDTSFAKNKTIIDRPFVVDNQTLQTMLVKTDDVYKVFQGRTLHVQLQANKPLSKAIINVLSQEYEFFPEAPNSLIYEAYVPVPCEETPNEYLFTVQATDKVGNSVKLDSKMQVVMFPFKKHTLQVSEQKMQEEERLGGDQTRLKELMYELTAQSPKEKLWKGAFCPPMDIAKITCDFGTIRTTQLKGRYAHKALDVVNMPKSVVWAPQDGVVVLKERFAYTGNTVIIDHGLGILSMFCHLSDFAKINVGDKICKGNPIGKTGSTGYATGDHLHWEMWVNNIAIDPMQWTKSNF